MTLAALNAREKAFRPPGLQIAFKSRQPPVAFSRSAEIADFCKTTPLTTNYQATRIRLRIVSGLTSARACSSSNSNPIAAAASAKLR